MQYMQSQVNTKIFCKLTSPEAYSEPSQTSKMARF